MKDLKVGDLVVACPNDDAVIWKVVEVDSGYLVGVVDAESKRTDLKREYIDKSLLQQPNAIQLAQMA